MSAHPLKAASLDVAACPSATHSYHISKVASRLNILGPTLRQIRSLPILLHICNWDTFPSSELQMAADKLYSFLHKCFARLVRAKIQSMSTRGTTMIDYAAKPPNFGKYFLEPRVFLCFYHSDACQND